MFRIFVCCLLLNFLRSKSAPAANSRINLLDAPEDIVRWRFRLPRQAYLVYFMTFAKTGLALAAFAVFAMQVKKIKKAKTDAVAGGVTAEMEVIESEGYGGASSEEVRR